MSKPRPERRSRDSRVAPSPSLPPEQTLGPGDEGYWHPAEQYVGIRVTCRTCGDNRLMGTLGLYTFPGDDGEPWFEGPGVEPAGWNTSLTLHCRKGHTVPMRVDRLLADLREMKEQVGENGRDVRRTAL